MKKYIIFLLSILILPLSGCTIDYEAYFEYYGDDILGDDGQVQTPPGNEGEEQEPPVTPPTEQPPVVEPPTVEPQVPSIQLNSEIIQDGLLSYPSNNSSRIAKYGEIYSPLDYQYDVYSSYYSSEYDVLYIAYEKIGTNDQRLDSRDLAIIEEHILFYFESDARKSEYRDYIKVIRIYSDYASSACRVSGDPTYYNIMGCADYDQVEASINLNGVTSLNDFFNDTQGYQPKRDTFAHEYGHVSTYYHMIVKNRGSYEEYLKRRLGNQYDIIYPHGLLQEYDSDDTYYIQPSEILADDYVDMFYNVSTKHKDDKNDYELAYTDSRNSLTGTGAVKDLNTSVGMYNDMKNYYTRYFVNETLYSQPKLVKANGNIYSTIGSVWSSTKLVTVSNKTAIVIGETTIGSNKYYKIIVANAVKYGEEQGDLRDYTDNVGYILKRECSDTSGAILKFENLNGNKLAANEYIPFSPRGISLLPYYEFSYFIDLGTKIEIYSLIDSSIGRIQMDSSQLK